MNIKRIVKNSNIDVICVDCFDTLVSRKHTPKYPSLVWCRKMIDYFGLSLSVNKLYWLRRDFIEVGDVLYRDGVEALLDYLKKQLGYDIDEQVFYEKSKEFDESAELSEIRINKKLVKHLSTLKKNGKKIFLVSDFYLEKDFFISLFSKHDILDLFDEIYVSSELGKTKYDGTLYEQIKNDYKDLSFLMIGDNKKSDYIKSRQNGFYAVHYNALNEKIKKVKNEFENIKYDRLSFGEYKKIYKKRTKSGLISNYVFSLFDFCERLYKKCIREKINILYFQSREGQFLQRLFNMYQDGKYRKIQTKYFIASRYSTFLPSLYGKEINPQTFYTLTMGYKDMSLSIFLKNLQFSEEEIVSLNIKNIDREIINIADSVELLEFLKNDTFVSIYTSKVENSYLEFNKYFNSIFGDNKDITIVDAGWTGTMQNNLAGIFKDRNLNGIYLGLNRYHTIANNKKCGLLWDIQRNPYSLYTIDFELLLKADHGNVIGYKDCEPILEDDGDVLAYNNIVKFIQNDMLTKFNELICARNKDITYYDSRNYLCLMHKKMQKNANIKMINLIYNISEYHSESFGLLSNGNSLVKSNKIKHLIFRKIRYYVNAKIQYAKMDNWE